MFQAKFGRKLAARSKSFFSQLETLARKTGLIRRVSKKFSASGLVLTLLKAVSSGKGSFNQLAITMDQSEMESCSAQALWKRIDQRAVHFMMEVTAQALTERWSKEQVIAAALFKRVIIEDSSQTKLPASNHEEFPGHGNGSGETAGCKFDLAFDLLTGEVIFDTLRLATDQDRELGKDLVDLVEENDLVLRDMGYFSLSEFGRIAALGAWWLSRLPANVTAHDQDGRKLEMILRNTKAARVEFEALVGEVGHPARLIAVRATAPVARQRRRQRRQKATELGKSASKDMLTRDAWHIMITNVEEVMMGAKELSELYRVRWQVEITFRAWKQSAHLEVALKRRSNPYHLQALMYAGILMLILTMKTAALLQKTYRDDVLSIEKIADAFTSNLATLTSLESFATYNPDHRHLRMDRRSRKSLHQIAHGLLG